MVFRVIEGGLSTSQPTCTDMVAAAVLSRDVVFEEAERRIRAVGYESLRNRQVLTGIPVPQEIGYLVMQIRYVAEAIARLADIPADFRSDAYWPA